MRRVVRLCRGPTQHRGRTGIAKRLGIATGPAAQRTDGATQLGTSFPMGPPRPHAWYWTGDPEPIDGFTRPSAGIASSADSLALHPRTDRVRARHYRPFLDDLRPV